MARKQDTPRYAQRATTYERTHHTHTYAKEKKNRKPQEELRERKRNKEMLRRNTSSSKRLSVLFVLSSSSEVKKKKKESVLTMRHNRIKKKTVRVTQSVVAAPLQYKCTSVSITNNIQMFQVTAIKKKKVLKKRKMGDTSQRQHNRN